MPKKRRKIRVALIFGGKSNERKVSLNSAKSIAENLDSNKYDVIPVEISKAGKFLLDTKTVKQIGEKVDTKKITGRELIPFEKSAEGKIDVALLALHGPGGEDGTIQGMLELLGIPYTDSGVLASSLAMDKARAKRLVTSAGVPVLPHIVISKKDFKRKGKKLLREIKGKVAVKPNRLGSSIGVTISGNKQEIAAGIVKALKYGSEVIIEPFVEGREITVPVLGNDEPRVLPIVEIVPRGKSKFYDYAAKYAEGGSEHIIPAPLSLARQKAVKEFALVAHKVLGCRGATRVDFIMDKKGDFYFLEINTIPGMTATSLVPQAAAAAGINYSKLLDILIGLAFEK